MSYDQSKENNQHGMSKDDNKDPNEDTDETKKDDCGCTYSHCFGCTVVVVMSFAMTIACYFLAYFTYNSSIDGSTVMLFFGSSFLQV